MECGLVLSRPDRFGFNLAKTPEAVGKVKPFRILSRGGAKNAKIAEFLSEFFPFSQEILLLFKDF